MPAHVRAFIASCGGSAGRRARSARAMHVAHADVLEIELDERIHTSLPSERTPLGSWGNRTQGVRRRAGRACARAMQWAKDERLDGACAACASSSVAAHCHLMRRYGPDPLVFDTRDIARARVESLWAAFSAHGDFFGVALGRQINLALDQFLSSGSSSGSPLGGRGQGGR